MPEREYTEIEETARDLLEHNPEDTLLLETIKKVNKMSESGDITEEEMADLLPVFNDKWAHYQGLFQGYGRAYSVEDGEARLFGNDDEETIISFGFAINEGDEFSELVYHIGAINLEQNTVEEFFLARLDDFYIDTAVRQDGVRATYLFKHFYPDIANEIEDNFFKADSDIDFILSLRSFSIDHDERDHLPEEADPEEIRSLLTKMLDHQVPLRTSVPWSVAFSGIYFPVRSEDLSINPEDAQAEYAWQKWLALPRGIVMIPSVEMDSESGYYSSNRQVSRPAISLFIFRAKEDEAPNGQLIVVPITENLKIVSNLENIETFEELEDS